MREIPEPAQSLFRKNMSFSTGLDATSIAACRAKSFTAGGGARKDRWPARAGHSSRRGDRQRLLQRRDVCILLALRSLLHFETHLLIFLKRFEPASLHLREMCEQVFSAAVRRDEAKTLCIVEPLHSTCCHFQSSQ